MRSQIIVIALLFVIISCDKSTNIKHEKQITTPSAILVTKNTEVPNSNTIFDQFDQETEAIDKLLGSHESITPSEPGIGALYGTIKGQAQTVKIFVNEIPGTNKVADVKIMWNDWIKDIGFGLHPDRRDASEVITKLIPRYAPKSLKPILIAFFGKTNKKFKENSYTLIYTYGKGPGIAEHLIVITKSN